MAFRIRIKELDPNLELDHRVRSPIYAILARLTLTSSLFVFVAFGSAISWVVRYRYLNMYARLPPEPQRKEPNIEMVPDTQEESGTRPGMSNYLDEFLSAIKVFGYLERPVFHELTRTMQTRKLMAGETLLLEEEKGFCLVVDGMVQIFVKSNKAPRSPGEGHSVNGHDQTHGEEEPREDRQGYQLLTEVKNGAPMSSLFSVLSLFTEDVKLRHDPENANGLDGGFSPSYPSGGTPELQQESPARTPFPPLDHESQQNQFFELRNGLPIVPPMSLDETGLPKKQSRGLLAHKRAQRKSAHPDIVARATSDTMIAIIPATAFRRLTRVYPKATAHIIQVILSRLQRVTLATAHSYLGLTTEVLDIEKLMDRYTNYDLPNHLRGQALDRLKEKFKKEEGRLKPDDDGTKGIALHNPHIGRHRRSVSSVRKDLLGPLQIKRLRSNVEAPESAHGDASQFNVSPGDLLATIQTSRFPKRNPSLSPEKERELLSSPLGVKEPIQPLTRLGHPSHDRSPSMALQRQQSYNEDEQFRRSILTSMTKAIGLVDVKSAMLTRGTESADQSPRLVSYDARRQQATFANAFGFIGSYDGSNEGETESLVSTANVSPSLHYPANAGEELLDDIEIVYFPKGAVLIEEGERNPGLYYVLDGFLDVGYSVDEPRLSPYATRVDSFGRFSEDYFSSKGDLNSKRSYSLSGSSTKSKKKQSPRENLSLVKPGGLAGYIGSLSGYRSFVDIRAKTDVYVGFLPRDSLERVTEKYPVILLTMAKRMTSLLPRLILHIDFALEWVQVDAGDLMHHQGEDSDAIYIVLNGRLRAIAEKGGGEMRVVGEYGQGESVGELEVMTETPRPANIHAIRDTELAKLPKTLFNSLALEHPGITIKVSKIIAQRVGALLGDPIFEQGREKKTAAVAKPVTSSLNLRTVAILPIASDVPIVEFSSRLLHALGQIGIINGVTSLTQTAVLNHLGRHAFSRMGKLKLSQYLADLEERYGMLLYVADTPVSAPWTRTCITQADCILLVGLAEASASIGDYERFLLGTKSTARKDLVLLHVERYSPPGLTRRWLQNRPWINGGHYHIQMAFRTQPEPVHPQIKRIGTAIKQRVQTLQAEIQKYTSRRVRQTPLYSAETPFKGDFHRLARRLCGKSVGLVLGGGGARGITQVGVIRALEEAGIPIDIIGGTSIGAFIGALYARDADVVPMYGRAKRFAGRMGSMWRFALDLTYPSASYTTGHEFNRGIFKTFGDSQIEDFWLEFYCNTTNITKSRSEIHTSGYVWRYVRASMSLAGLIPPLCENGSLLLDGGYIDNLTVAHMKSLGADTVFAVDVGALDDDKPQIYGDTLSGMWALLNRWNPFSNYPNPPTLSEIQARLAYVSSVDALERAKTTPGCLYMRPPIDPFGTLEFNKFDELYQVGYKYGMEYLAQLREEGVLPSMEESEEKKKLRRTMAPRRASI